MVKPYEWMKQQKNITTKEIAIPNRMEYIVAATVKRMSACYGRGDNHQAHSCHPQYFDCKSYWPDPEMVKTKPVSLNLALSDCLSRRASIVKEAITSQSGVKASENSALLSLFLLSL